MGRKKLSNPMSEVVSFSTTEKTKARLAEIAAVMLTEHGERTYSSCLRRIVETGILHWESELGLSQLDLFFDDEGRKTNQDYENPYKKILPQRRDEAEARRKKWEAEKKRRKKFNKENPKP